MEKFVGNVKMNYDCYGGSDLYSDGAIEDILLDIAKNNTEYSLSSFIFTVMVLAMPPLRSFFRTVMSP